MVDESRPPEAQTPSGTSETRCSRTESRSSSSSSSLASLERHAPARSRGSFHHGSIRTSPVAPLQQVPGRHLLDAPISVRGAGNVVHRQVACPAPARSSRRGTRGCSRIAFSSEPKYRSSPAPVVVQRLDPHAVARQHQPLPRFRPQRHREHAAQPREALRVPLQERVQHRFGVAVGAEPVAQRFELVRGSPDGCRSRR